MVRQKKEKILDLFLKFARIFSNPTPKTENCKWQVIRKHKQQRRTMYDMKMKCNQHNMSMPLKLDRNKAIHSFKIFRQGIDITTMLLAQFF